MLKPKRRVDQNFHGLNFSFLFFLSFFLYKKYDDYWRWKEENKKRKKSIFWSWGLRNRGNSMEEAISRRSPKFHCLCAKEIERCDWEGGIFLPPPCALFFFHIFFSFYFIYKKGRGYLTVFIFLKFNSVISIFRFINVTLNYRMLAIWNGSH